MNEQINNQEFLIGLPFWYFTWEKFNLNENNIEEFIKLIELNKIEITTTNSKDLIDELINKKYIISIDNNQLSLYDKQVYLEYNQLINFINLINNLINQYNLPITFSLETIEEALKVDINCYTKYISAKNDNTIIKYEKNSIIYLLNENLKKIGYRIFELNDKCNLYFIANKNEIEKNSATELYR